MHYLKTVVLFSRLNTIGKLKFFFYFCSVSYSEAFLLSPSMGEGQPVSGLARTVKFLVPPIKDEKASRIIPHILFTEKIKNSLKTGKSQSFSVVLL